MFAIESFGNGCGQSVAAQIVGEHRRPRDRLQRGPVRAGGQHQREHDEAFSKTRKHGDKLDRTGQIAI